MYNHIDENCINLVHEFLGTEINQRNKMSKVIPYLQESTKFVCYYNNIGCAFCYEDAIEHGKKYGKCVNCSHHDRKIYIPFTFKQYRKTEIDNMFKGFSKCGYDIFKLIIETRPCGFYDYKFEINYEIDYGPDSHYYSKDKYDKLVKLMWQYRK